jgi:hypothetical protein
VTRLPGAEPEANVVDRGCNRSRDQAAENDRLKDRSFGALDFFFCGQLHVIASLQKRELNIVNTEIGI